VVVTCIDFRFQKNLENWARQNVGEGQYDRVSYAGSVKNWADVFEQIKLSKKLHDIKKVVLINHEDCGAYGAEGTMERHSGDLKRAHDTVKREFPELSVELYVAMLDGSMTVVA
jgi:carbonic anhydrase